MKKLILILAVICLNNLFAQEFKSLEQGFHTPPNEAKARTWWHWISGNVSKSGITKDLEAMKRVGIQEAQLFNVQLEFPSGDLEYFSKEWLDLFHFAAEEAERLNLELAFHNSAGWSSSGGPWVTPENAMQTVVFSEVNVIGNQVFNQKLPQPETKLDYYKDIAVLAFPKPKITKKVNGLDYKNLSGRIRNHLLPDVKDIMAEALISKPDIIDLTTKLSNDGTLTWTVPKGEWTVIRFGHTPKGKKNHPAPNGGHGLEVDKMSKKAVDAYWNEGVQPIINKLGNLIGSTVTNCLIDSYEVGSTNWTLGFNEQFKRLKGYDLTPFLPTLAGYYVESGEITERFLWDFRRTIGDLMAENYYAHFAKLCHDNNLKFSVEPYWGPFDNMQVGATGDIVMCEFWSGGYPFFDSPKFVSSIAHLNGSAIVGAESFTGIGGWDDHPAQLKSIGDRAWAEGITRFIFHTYVHQPWDIAPGLALSYHGTDFNRLNTWWEQGKGFMDYIARSQYLLQQGKNVADVLVFTGESSPNTAFLLPEIKTLGYDYDLIGSNKFDDLLVKNGKIYTSHSGPYSVLALTDTNWMKPETLKKVKELATAGAKIIGAKPSKSPSLENFPVCDKEIISISEYLWENGLVNDQPVIEFLKSNDLPADFYIEEGNAADISFVHRQTKDADIYFIANAKKERRDFVARFRVSAKQPELWNAETGNIKDMVVFNENTDGTTSVPITLGTEEAVFIVFKKPINSNHLINTKIELERPSSEPLSNLKIIKADYGTFLQEGLLDITDLVKKEVKDNQLDFYASRQFCDCDPAMGYVKEFRMEYQIDGKTQFKTVLEKEHASIDAGDKELTIVRAVFGKFKPETKNVPKYYPYHDITETIKKKVRSGVFEIPVTDALLNNEKIAGSHKTLKIVFSTDGEEQTILVPEGQILKLSKDNTNPELIFTDKDIQWVTPYNGKITYTTNTGQTQRTKVKSVPKPLKLSGEWNVSFPLNSGIPENTKFPELISWSAVEDERIKHFSGTATYTKEFELTSDYLKPDKQLELDLGSVAVIAEVTVNGSKAGILWKAPFRIKIDDFIKKGKNILEIKITNLWPNNLIGDEKLPLDIERKGAQTIAKPNWLKNNRERTSGRTTFPSWNHYNKDSNLLTSGLLGPVQINVLSVNKLLNTD